MLQGSLNRRHNRIGQRTGFTLVELLVVIGVIALLMSILLPTLGRAREQANRIKCASNLREIARGCLLYAASNRDQFPRTYHRPGSGLENTNKGGLGNAPVANPFSATAPEDPVGPSNSGASLYLLVRGNLVAGQMFTCPSNRMAVPWDYASADRYSNFPSPMRNHNSYSYGVPMPNNTAFNQGWRLTPRNKPDWPLASDLNPGKGGNNFTTTDAQDVTAVRFDDDKRTLAKGNSNNHENQGQQVVYVDGHVEWHTTPFAGPFRPSQGWRDNIYANTNGVDLTTGKGGAVHSQPNDRWDAVLHPGDGAS